MRRARILFPLPDRDFDVTEAAVPWYFLTQAGHEVVFATEAGAVGACDPLLLTGVIFGQLGATKEAIEYYDQMIASEAFRHPLRYDQIDVASFDMLHLTGGHAPGMKQYLESKVLQAKALQFFQAAKPVGSICHGAVLLARTIDPATGKSVVHGRQLSGLTKFLERLAYYITAWRRGKYYRTYPAYVQDEVTVALGKPELYQEGRKQFEPYVHVEGNLVSARWPKDAWLYSEKLVQVLATLPERVMA